MQDHRGIVVGRFVTQLAVGRMGPCSLVFPSCVACSLELRYVSDVVGKYSLRGGSCCHLRPCRDRDLFQDRGMTLGLSMGLLVVLLPAVVPSPFELAFAPRAPFEFVLCM